MSEHTNPVNPKPPSVDRLSQLWRRINDHKMVQWSVAYVALAYGIQHGVELTIDAFEWSHTVVRVSMLLLVLGLPLVMTLAWYHGERASRRISGPELTIISLLLVGISLLFYVFARPSEQVAAAPAVQQASVAAARSASLNPGNAISIAVLPFANLSDDKQQEFFSDGMTEEITTALAKIPDLRVVARESAFQFKAQNRDIQSIGQQLHATHFIEGSVRKAGNRVRITAQLVNAENGVNVWTDSYDRDLTDVFAIQEDIARAIAASLRMPLGIKPGEQLVNARTASPASHENYLRAKGLVETRNFNAIAEAIKLLEETVIREPDYAPALGLLGSAYHLQLLVHPAVLSGAVEEARPIVQANLAKGQAAAKRAVKLDPKSADGYVALAQMRTDVGDRVLGIQLAQQALSLDPDNPEALQFYSIQLALVGDMKQSLAVRDHLLAVEPFVPVFQGVTARLLFGAGQTDAALAILKKQRPSAALAQIYAAQGQYTEAADILAVLPASDLSPLRAAAIRLLRAAPKAAPANDRPELGIMDWVYLYVGDPERFLSAYEKGVRMGYLAGANGGFEWAPAYADIRKTERFKKYIRDAGILAYWRAKGWPDRCHPTTGDDFVCN